MRLYVRTKSGCIAAAALLSGLFLGACAGSQAPGLAAPANDSSSMTPIVVGHRGASGYRPEHTLASYALAIEQGADYVEPDLVITADGVLVARHENEIGGTTNIASHPEFAESPYHQDHRWSRGQRLVHRGFLSAESEDTARARTHSATAYGANTRFDGEFEIPTFAEIIALVRTHNERLAAEASRLRKPAPRPVGLYPETKHPSYFRKLGKPLEEPLVEALRRAGLDSAQAPVFIQSFETGNLRMLRSMTHVRLIQLLEDQGAPYDLVLSGSATTYADLVTPPGLTDIATYAYGIGAAKELVIPRTTDGLLGRPTSLVRDAHERGLQVLVWTFRRENGFLPVNLRSNISPGDIGSLDQEIDIFLKTGIDGVFSDNPDIAVNVRGR